MGEIEKVAMISDALEQLVPNSKITVIFELNKSNFEEFSKRFNKDGSSEDKNFNIDMSGTYFYFTMSEAE